MRYLHVEWMLAVPDSADIELLRSQAAVLVPTEFHGIDEIIGRVYVTRDSDETQDKDLPTALLREFATTTMTPAEASDWYRRVKFLLDWEDEDDGQDTQAERTQRH